MPLADGNQTLLGTVGNDTMTVGGIVVPHAALGMISTEPLPYFVGQAYDGVWGLGFNTSAFPLLSSMPTAFLISVSTCATPSKQTWSKDRG